MVENKDLNPKDRTIKEFERRVRRIAGRKGSRQYVVPHEDGEKHLLAISRTRSKGRNSRSLTITDRVPVQAGSGSGDRIRTRISTLMPRNGSKRLEDRMISTQTGVAQNDSELNILDTGVSGSLLETRITADGDLKEAIN